VGFILKILLETSHLSKTYGRGTVLKPTDLTLYDGEVMAILGPSGGGKTTLLKLIAGLLPIEEGKVIYNGQVINHLPAHRRPIVMMFQQPLLFPHLTIYENVAYGLKAKRLKKEKIREKVMAALGWVHLTGQEEKYPSQLSGGQQQRIALARALVIDSAILLLDEPLSSLDPILRQEMRHLLKELLQQLKRTAILVTHDREEAMQIADRIALLIDGEIKQVGTARELYHQPNSPQVAQFFGDAILLSGIWSKTHWETNAGLIPTQPFQANFMAGEKVAGAIFPHHLNISSNYLTLSSQITLPAIYLTSFDTGEAYKHHLRVAQQLITVTSTEPLMFSSGEQIQVTVMAGQIPLFAEKKKN
jgi:ABC-type Fe3+/spermidine/putrescine transport system ATPase subunit